MFDLSNSKKKGQQLGKKSTLVSVPKFSIFREKYLEYFQNLSGEMVAIKGKYAIHSDLERICSPRFSIQELSYSSESITGVRGLKLVFRSQLQTAVKVKL